MDTLDSIAPNSPADTGAARARPGPVDNPEDSAAAAAYAVEVSTAQTLTSAILRLHADSSTLPSATFAALPANGATSYRVLAGAFLTRQGADSLLAELRRQNLIDSAGGMVVRVPYAYRIDQGIPAAAAAGVVSELVRRGIPAYALIQENGRAWILAGAFETPSQAVPFARSVAGIGAAVILVFRKGRPL